MYPSVPYLQRPFQDFMHILQKNLMVSSQVLRALLLDKDGDTMQASIFLLMSSQLTSTTAMGLRPPLSLLSLLEIGERAKVIGYPVGRSSSDQEMGDDDGDEDGDDVDSSCCC